MRTHTLLAFYFSNLVALFSLAGCTLHRGSLLSHCSLFPCWIWEKAVESSLLAKEGITFPIFNNDLLRDYQVKCFQIVIDLSDGMRQRKLWPKPICFHWMFIVFMRKKWRLQDSSVISLDGLDRSNTLYAFLIGWFYLRVVVRCQKYYLLKYKAWCRIRSSSPLCFLSALSTFTQRLEWIIEH